MYAAINDTLREIANVIKPRPLQDRRWIPTVAGQFDYPLPADVLAIQHPLVLADPQSATGQGSSAPLVHLNKDDFDAINPYPEATAPSRGIPHFYTIWENCLLLFPNPDRIYRIYMNLGREATELNSALDQMFLQDAYFETVKAGVLTRLYAGIQLADDAMIWQRVYRYGFAGNEGFITGGLEQLKITTRDLQHAPAIVKYNGNF